MSASRSCKFAASGSRTSPSRAINSRTSCVRDTGSSWASSSRYLYFHSTHARRSRSSALASSPASAMARLAAVCPRGSTWNTDVAPDTSPEAASVGARRAAAVSARAPGAHMAMRRITDAAAAAIAAENASRCGAGSDRRTAIGSVLGDPGRRAARPRADARRACIVDAAVGDAGGAHRAVGTEDALVHRVEVTAIERHVDAERGATVLSQGLAGIANDAVRHVQRRRGVDLEELVVGVESGDVANVDGAAGLDRERVLADIHPHDVVDGAAVVDVDAVRAVGADDDVAQRRAVLDAEHRVLALVLTAVAQLGTGGEPAASAIERAAGDADRLVHDGLGAVGSARRARDPAATAAAAAAAAAT